MFHKTAITAAATLVALAAALASATATTAAPTPSGLSTARPAANERQAFVIRPEPRAREERARLKDRARRSSDYAVRRRSRTVEDYAVDLARTACAVLELEEQAQRANQALAGHYSAVMLPRYGLPAGSRQIGAVVAVSNAFVTLAN